MYKIETHSHTKEGSACGYSDGYECARARKEEGYDVSARNDLAGFPDGSDSAPYAVEALQWAAAEGILLGMDDGSLRPEQCVTRAQVAAIMARFVRRVK